MESRLDSTKKIGKFWISAKSEEMQITSRYC